MRLLEATGYSCTRAAASLGAWDIGGIEPQYRQWAGGGSLTAFVLSQNLHRRHLTDSQKAAVAVEVLPWFEKEAKERQATSTGGKKPQLRAEIPEAARGRARDQAAKTTGASPRYIEDAKADQG
jgi:hypothetical protein